MRKQGFGKSQPATRDAKQFMRAFIKCVEESQASQPQIDQFLKSHLAKLDESLLDSLPLVFATLTTHQLPEDQEKIARSFRIFGDSLRVFPWGSRSQNLEISISAYRLALQVYAQKSFLQEWAAVQNNLGIAYHERIQGERSENLEQAITAFELALQVYAHEDFAEYWAETQVNLGYVYCERIQGNRSENLERAIDACNLALEVFTRESFPRAWGIVQNNLGNAYLSRIQGERSENLEQAIIAFESALQVYTLESFPEDWAKVQANLVGVHCNRIRGEQSENLEQAIMACNLALEVFTRESFPGDWAITQHNLAKVYRDRLKGNRAKNLEQAILTFKEAAQVFTREVFPERWVENEGHLAEALMESSTLTGDVAMLETAINLLQTSLEVAVPGSPHFIDSQYRLGNALSRRYDFSQNPADLQQAVKAYKIALDAISPEHYDRQRIWQALPTTQFILGSRLVEDGRWQEGLQLLLNSLNQLKTGNNSLIYANALFQTGYTYEVLSDWDNARLYYRDALRLYEYLKDQAGIARSCAGLGSVLIFQGHIGKGLTELSKAREVFYQLHQLDQAGEVEYLYQATQQREMQWQQTAKVFV
jgi:tetratricopeptide (TPR) repeat protein